MRNAKSFLASVSPMVKGVSIRTILVRTLLSKQNALKIMQEMYAYGFNNHALLIHNALISKAHLVLYANNTQINVLVMVKPVFPFPNVPNTLIRLVAHLESMENVDGLITLVLPLRSVLILMLLLQNYANHILVNVFLMARAAFQRLSAIITRLKHPVSLEVLMAFVYGLKNLADKENAQMQL